MHAPEFDRLVRDKERLAGQIKRDLIKYPGFEGVEIFDADLLASVASAAFAADQVSPTIPNSHILAKELALEHQTSIETALRLLGGTRNQNQARLIDSPLVESLRNLDPRKIPIYQRQLGTLYAWCFIVDQVINQPVSLKKGVRIRRTGNPKIAKIDDLSAEPVDVPTPRSVLEFGPGLNGLIKLGFGNDISLVRNYTMVEPNLFVATALSGVYGVTDRLVGIINRQIRRNPSSKEEAQKIGRLNVIQQTMGQYSLGRDRTSYDFIIASMVHSAGDSEITSALSKASNLLRDGGYLAIQAPNQVQPGETSAQRMLEIATSFYGHPIRQVQIDLKVETTGEEHIGISALYRK